MSAVKTAPPKPCPRCYTPMRQTANGWACAKHGAPLEPAREPRESPRRERRPLAPKITRRPRRTVRFPSDLKTYPLPPSPDGRDHGRTSADSPTTARSRLTPPLLARIFQDYDAGASVQSVAASIWKDAGYASRDACKGSVYRALRRTGRATTSQAEPSK